MTLSRSIYRLALRLAVPVLLVLSASSQARADYPLVSHRYLADPGSVVYGGRVYLYNSNDDDNDVGGGYSMHSIVCVSSSDMKNWTDHGIVFQVPADASWAGDSWAPQPVARDGTIFLYFGNNANGIGVASSTDPIGRFKDAKGSALVTSSTPGASGTNIWLFDPGVLIDDDGQAYLAFGGNGENNARMIKLGADLESVSGSAAAFSPTGFFEASFLFKRNDVYYFAYSSDSSHGLRIDYMKSESPMSGYTYAGTIAGQPPVNDNNNHASEFEFNGQWYHAYHNRSVATAAGISTTYRRNIALEVLNFNPDGSIKEVTYTTDGVPQVGHVNPYTRVEAETMNAQSGIETEPCTPGGMDVTQISDGDWVRVRGVDFGTAGAKTFSASVASAAGGGTIELRLDSATGMLVGTCDVPATGGAQTWLTTTCDVAGATGVKDLYLKFTGSGAALFNVDYWQFTGGGGNAGAGGTGGMGGMGGMPGGAAGESSGMAGMGGAGRGGAANAGTPSTGGAGASGSSASGRSGDASSGAGQAGTPGAGGMSAGSAGTPGVGGRAAGAGGLSSGGAPSAGASPSSSKEPGSDSGCGCRVTGNARHDSGVFCVGLGLVGLLGLRRQAGRKTRRPPART